MKVGIVAGEKSGDFLGSELIKALRQRYPGAEFVGLCGPLMQAEGAKSLDDMDKISIFGLEGLFSAIFEILAIRRKLYKAFVSDPPDLFIGIDVPDFNLGLARKLKARGIPTIHYVSPTVWAWRGGRIKKIMRSVDLMLTLFPFEEQFYRRHHMPVKYVGHPLARQILNWRVDAGFKESIVKSGQTLIAVLPGSRMSEVSRLAPEMISAATRLKQQRPELSFVIPCASNRIRQYLEQNFDLDAAAAKLIDGHSRDLLSVSDLAVLASGTAALEAALFARPMVVMYKISGLSKLIYERTITVEHYSMPNHLTNPPVVPELIQENATAENLCTEVERLLDQPDYYQHMQGVLSEIAPALELDSGAIATQAIDEFIHPRA